MPPRTLTNLVNNNTNVREFLDQNFPAAIFSVHVANPPPPRINSSFPAEPYPSVNQTQPSIAAFLNGETMLKHVGSRISHVLFGFSVALLLTSCAPPPRQMDMRTAIQIEANKGDIKAQVWIATDDFWTREQARQDSSAAFAKLKALSDGGIASAQFNLGNIYFANTTNKPRDPAKSFELISKSAAQKYVPAMLSQSFMYGMGIATEKDGTKAYSIAQQAYELDPGEGAVAIGDCYQNGWGVAKNEKDALSWYNKSANTKTPIGFLKLGNAYRDGVGGKQDPIIAFALYQLASIVARGREKIDAEQERDKVGLSLLPGDITLAQDLAQKWVPNSDLNAIKQSLQQNNPQVAATEKHDEPSLIHASATSSNYGKLVGDANLPYIDNISLFEINVSPNGDEVNDSHLERVIRKQAAVANLSQIALPYSTSLNTLEIVEAYTRKADGTKFPVLPNAIYEQPIPGAPNAPTFNDLRQKVVVFPNVTAGDALVLRTRMTSKPMIPGVVSLSMNFSRTYAARSAILRLTAPTSMPIKTETHELDFQRRSAGDKTIYEWRFTNPNPLVNENIGLDPMDRLPRLFLSNVSSYEELARRYADEIKSTLIVTSNVQALANQITAGATSPQQQAKLLHDWVSHNIRYVAVAFGREAIIPHDPDSILNNRYGDCKDHAVLLTALLKAKGIAAHITLINLGESYSLPRPPEIGTFNHAITYIPSLDIYTDTTSSFAPFGTLTFGEYGKPVLVIGDATPLRRTPLLAPSGTSATIMTKAKLNADGTLSGDTTITTTGPYAVSLRQFGSSIEAMGSELAARNLLQAMSKDGEGNFTINPPYPVQLQYSISGRFSLISKSSLVNGNSFVMPSGLNFLVRPGDQLMGPLELSELPYDEPTPCYGGNVTETIELQIPANRQIRELPKGTKIQNAHLTFTSHWAVADNKVTLTRSFQSNSTQAVCNGAVRQKTAGALNEIRKDYNTEIALK